MKLRRNILPFVWSVLIAVGVSSCVYDDEPVSTPGSNNGGGSSTTGKLTVTMRIKALGAEGSGSGVDGELVDGEHKEHAIGSKGNFALFFNADSTFYSLSQLLKSEEETPDTKEIETVYKTELDPADFDELPKFCLVMLNAPKYYELFTKYTEANKMKEAIAEIWEETKDPRNIGRTDDGYFVMTNSTYYDANGKLHNYSELTESMIYDPTDVKQKLEHDILTVYVERLSAKFSLEVQNTLEEDGYLYDPEADPIIFFNGFSNGAPQLNSSHWQILVTGWNLNAFETNIKMFKYLESGKNYFPQWPGWKDVAAFRTYWSEDPHYKGPYPVQYRRADDVGPNLGVNYYEDFEERDRNSLRNYSYSALSLDDPATFGKTYYAPENTYDPNLFESLGDYFDMLAGTHVLIGARLLTQGNDGTMKARNLWRDRNGFYYETELECLQSLIHSFNNSMGSQQYMRFPYYQWGMGGKISEATSTADHTLNGEILYAKTDNEDETIEYRVQYNNTLLDENTINRIYRNDIMAKGTIGYGDGKRLPWPETGTLKMVGTKTVNDVKSSVTLGIYRLNEATGTYVRVRDVTENDIKSMMYEWLGAVDHFDAGRMYYAVPAKIVSGIFPEGRDLCGVVRNAWYQYNLVSMKRMGTPVDDIAQPIVPSPANHHEQLNVTIKILDWHIFNSWIDALPN